MPSYSLMVDVGTLEVLRYHLPKCLDILLTVSPLGQPKCRHVSATIHAATIHAFLCEHILRLPALLALVAFHLLTDSDVNTCFVGCGLSGTSMMIGLSFFFLPECSNEMVTAATTHAATAMAATATAPRSDAAAHRNEVTQSYCMITAIQGIRHLTNPSIGTHRWASAPRPGLRDNST